MKQQIVSAGSHPSELAISLHFWDQDSRIQVTVILGEQDMYLIESHIRVTRQNYKPWIRENFHGIDDRTWQCLTCNQSFIGSEKHNVIDAMAGHLVIHGKTV